MIAGVYNMVCEQGTSFYRSIILKEPDPEDSTGTTYNPVALTNHTARMQVRRTVKSTSLLAELTTENGGIALEADGETGLISLSMSDVQTSALTSDGVYDLELIDDSGNVSRVLQGTFTLSLEVTR